MKVASTEQINNPFSGETLTSLAGKFNINVKTLNKYIQLNDLLKEKIKNKKSGRRILFMWEVKLICETLNEPDIYSEISNNIKNKNDEQQKSN